MRARRKQTAVSSTAVGMKVHFFFPVYGVIGLEKKEREREKKGG